MQLGRRPSATCSNVHGCGRTRTSGGLVETPDLQSGAIAALPHTRVQIIASYGSRTRSNTSTGCHAIRYTNETSLPGRAGESNPRHDIHSVGCCHYTKLAISEARMYMRGFVNFATEEEGLEPSPPDRAAALSRRVRRTDIRLSSLGSRQWAVGGRQKNSVLPSALILLPSLHAPART